MEEALNLEYYTFKYRPQSTEQILAAIKESGLSVKTLAGVERSFCCFVMGSVERVFTKDVDQAVIEGVLDFWVQTSKLPLVEYLIDRANRALTGERIAITFQPGDNVRKASVIFDNPGEPEMDLESQIGEAARISVGVLIALNPDVVTYSDYTVSFAWTEGENGKTATIPLASLSMANIMTPKPVPLINNPLKVGQINISSALSWVLVFDGYNNEFINYITNKSMSPEDNDNNEVFTMVVTRAAKDYLYRVVIQDHQIVVASDTGNETHTLKLVNGGMKSGIT